jgi:hypothetical protein
MYDARATAGVSPSQAATSRMPALMTRLRLSGVGDGPAFASTSAISTVAFQVRNSLAVKWAPARAAM